MDKKPFSSSSSWLQFGPKIISLIKDVYEVEVKVEIKDGDILTSSITSINKSRDGYVGSKNANINYTNKIGTITKNTNSNIWKMY